MNREETLVKLRDLIRQDKYYVYLLIDPFTRNPLYVGKGRDYRVLKHSIHSNGNSCTNQRLTNKIKNLRKSGVDFEYEILADSTNEDVVYFLEAHFIRKFEILSRGGTLLNFTYGGCNNEYSTYYGLPFYNISAEERRRISDEWFGNAVYMQGFIYPSVTRANEVTRKYKSKSGLIKAIKTGTLFDSCFIDDLDISAKDYDDKIAGIMKSSRKEIDKLLGTFSSQEVSKMSTDYSSNPWYIYYKLSEDADENIISDNGVYVDGLKFKSWKYAGQYFGFGPSYMKKLMRKGTFNIVQLK